MIEKQKDTDAGDDIEQLSLFAVFESASGYPIKDDIYTMGYPVFSLSKKKDIKIKEYRRGDTFIKIIPSSIGHATIYDKDILVYAISLIKRASETGKPHSRKIEFDAADFLRTTQRGDGGASYKRIVEACQRLRGTTVQMNIKTNEKEQTRGFGLIQDYDVIQSGGKIKKSAVRIQIVISEWLYRVVQENHILTLHPQYYELSSPLARRIYEIGRKFCGAKTYFKINLNLLREKVGSDQDMKFFKHGIKKLAESDSLPEYKIYVDESNKKNAQLVYIIRDTKKVADAVINDADFNKFYNRLRSK